MTLAKDYYAILGVHPQAEREVIAAAYRALAKKYHPDVQPDKALADRRIRELNEAYQVLSEPTARSKYDELQALRAGAKPAKAAAAPAPPATPRRPGGSSTASPPAPAPAPPRSTLPPQFLDQHFAATGALRDFARSLIGSGRDDLAHQLAAVVDRVGHRPETERKLIASFCADAGIAVPWAAMTVEQLMLAIQSIGYEVDRDPAAAVYRIARKGRSIFKDKFLFSDDEFRAYALAAIAED